MLTALESLQWHWGEVYTFSHPSEDRWVAQHKADRRTLTAATAAALRQLVRADYQLHRDGLTPHAR